MALVSEYRQRDQLKCLLKLKSFSPLNETDARELERLQICEALGMLDEDCLSEALATLDSTLDDPLLGPDHFQEPASKLAHDGGQNARALPAALDNYSPYNYYQHPASSLAGLGHHNTAATESLSLHNTAPENHNHNHFEQRQPASNWLAVTASVAAHTHTEGPTSDAATPGLSPEDDSAYPSAATIVPRANGALPPPGINGLRFTSLETAIAAADLVFRERVVAPVSGTGDDVLQVLEDKYHHVKSLLEVLKHDGYMPTPHEWRGEKNKMVLLTQEKKEDFVKWQERSCESIRAWLRMPNIDVRLERVAWEIFTEIIEVHRTGAKMSKLSKSKSSKCSERIQDGLVEMRKWANVRVKLINIDNIPKFAANPEGYANAAYTSRRNNFEREQKLTAALAAANTGKVVKAVKQAVAVGATGTGSKQGSREASEHGAIAHQCMPGPDARKRKRKVDQDAKASASASENNLPGNNNNQIQTPYGSGVSLYNDQMSVDTQHPRHRAQDLNVPGAMPPPPLPTQSGMPGGRPAKKRKTDGSGTESDTTSTQSAPFWADPFAHYGA